MYDIDFDEFEDEINKAEDYLSFAPTPKGSLLRKSSNQNIFFYDEEQDKSIDATEFSETMMDTIRFAAPIDPAIRSVEYSSSEPFFEHTGTISHLSDTRPSTESENEEDSLPRKQPPIAKSPISIKYRKTASVETVIQQPPKRKVKPLSLERIEELHQSRMKRQQNLLKEKHEMDKLKLAECTFQPKLSRGTKVILSQKAQFEQLDSECKNLTNNQNNTANETDNDHNNNISNSVSERLYREASIRTVQKRWIQQEVEKVRQSHYTFTPLLNPRAQAKVDDQRPIYERLSDIIKEKSQYMTALKESIDNEINTDLTFKPQIDSNSRYLAEQKLLDYGGNKNISPTRIRPRSASATRGSRSTTPTSTAVGVGGVVVPSYKLQQTQQQTSQHKLYSSQDDLLFKPTNKQHHQASHSLTGEAEAAIVFGFHTDVASRLINQGELIKKKKQLLLKERDDELAKAREYSALSKGSEKIVRSSHLKGSTFEERQKEYRIKEKQRKDAILEEQELQSNYWFRPNIDIRSRSIVSKQRPKTLLESIEQKTERLAVQDVIELNEKRKQRTAEVYSAYTFVPEIDPLSRALGRSHSIDELHLNNRAVQSRQRIRQTLEETETQNCTFQPQINELSRKLMEPSEQDSFFNSYINNNEYSTYGWAESKCPLNNNNNNTTSNIEQNIHEYASRTRNKRLNIQEPERMMHDIKIHQLKKEEKSRNELIIKEINELQECTFKPSLTNSFLSYEKQRKNSDNYEDKEESPVVIRGLGRYLELKYLSKKQKEEALERERNAFNVKNIEKYRRPEDGSTIVESFNFHLKEPRQHSRVNITSQESEELIPGSLNTSSVLSHRSYRRPTSPAAAAVWCL